MTILNRNLGLTLLLYRFAGRPGDYVYVFNDYRMEEVIMAFSSMSLLSTYHSCDIDIKCINP